ncbi:hypothetical protein [Hymenobacter wooponensis]|uniref:Uncharacterized protein n=1 Tax=Hymenobacter wooponensis TaxID=1525360 RepID=A0A4Z0ML55_9BACT|nr:hypothetical protein [Hymenobacter wooponensis]TGD80291.1 hypothetical protein EU557_10630 [Hymenobacter wooponensis]
MLHETLDLAYLLQIEIEALTTRFDEAKTEEDRSWLKFKLAKIKAELSNVQASRASQQNTGA